MTRSAGILLACGAAAALGSPPLSAQATSGELDSARAVMATITDTLTARRMGYRRIAPPSLTDLNPFAGEHWINERFNRTRRLDLSSPAYLMFYPFLGPDSLTLVGVGYTVAQPAGSPAPEGFPGSDDRWHVHLPCAGVPGLRGILAESIAACEALQGRPGPWQIAMAHVWQPAFESPDGPYAQFNPALPYRAVGIDPPTPAELADAERGVLLRELGLALGETFGAVPRMGARLSQNRDSVFADAVRPHRQRIGALLPSLRVARHDVATFLHLAREAVEAWRHIRDAYLDAARSPEHRQILDQWFEAARTGYHRTARHH